jgi:NADH:ubiquinone oxidoreductase subunit F (NADH-binding)
MVDMARFFWISARMNPAANASPAAWAHAKLLDILERISLAEGKKGILKNSSNLRLNSDIQSVHARKTAPTPVLSTLKHFRHEYEAHIYDKKCPARVCTASYTRNSS